MSNFGKLIISKFDDDYKTFHKLNLILVKGNRNAININHNIGKIVINGHSNKVFIKARSHIGKITLRGNNNKIYSIKLSATNNLSDYGRGNKVFYREDDESDDEDDSYFSNDDEEEEEEEEEEEDNNMRLINRNNEEIRLLLQQAIERLNQRQEERRRIQNIEKENEILSGLVDVSFKNVNKNVIEGNEKCVICYENFLKDENIKMTGCFHLFHLNCIKKWVQSKHGLDEQPDCPICRRNL